MLLVPLSLAVVVALRLAVFRLAAKPLVLTEALAALSVSTFLRLPAVREWVDPQISQTTGLANASCFVSLIAGLVCADRFVMFTEYLNGATRYSLIRRVATGATVVAMTVLYVAGDASSVQVDELTRINAFSVKALVGVYASMILIDAIIALITSILTFRGLPPHHHTRYSMAALGAGATYGTLYITFVVAYPLLDPNGDGHPNWPFEVDIQYASALWWFIGPMCIALALAGAVGPIAAAGFGRKRHVETS
ncbi:hypothetical protein [Antrihabitans stalactiti]|uniref:Uncharacterized protein n=1 Tax=Antrihabitans stalactiti TaxID=2584121 RepID=A0A848KMG7_9NOCA|nr:hypothetical protein [Antrihabitans stalactiti]NMN97460.1 hypothetical protein [Antrihabitans stalactiti]